jgi:hypothetical protein
MALINFGVLKEDQYTKADIYYPPWSLIESHDGESLILSKSDNLFQSKQNNEEKNDDTNSVYSHISEKSI